MNLNKLVFPAPKKTSQRNPFDRIQSAPPEGKEDDKNTDQALKNYFKDKPINPNSNFSKVLLSYKIP